ncbi:MAG: penicillin acylase family protein, partial [Gammaproteobacteria bacterium]
MKTIKRFLIYPAAVLTALLMIMGVVCFGYLRHSIPPADGQAEIAELSAQVKIAYGSHGIPSIAAENRLDAIRALGFVTARDRMFQMDLMRRKNAGRLAEIFGAVAVDSDIRARTFGFPRVARAVVAKLPRRHRDYLEAYSQGVNRYLEQAGALPFEFTVLGYRPEFWSAQDSILVALGMFDKLTARAEGEERMLSVMAKALPVAVVAFLTPDTDPYTDRLTGHAESLRPVRPIPADALETALARRPA